MSGRESVQPKEQPKLINASELVSLLARVGPGRNIRVRIHSKDGSIREGEVKWHDDRVNDGPVIVIPNKDPFKEEIMPLGGQTVYDSPPKVSSSDNARNKAYVFGKVNAHTLPIKPGTKGILFEIINKK